jgi:hypothetical protein
MSRNSRIAYSLWLLASLLLILWIGFVWNKLGSLTVLQVLAGVLPVFIWQVGSRFKRQQ